MEQFQAREQRAGLLMSGRSSTSVGQYEAAAKPGNMVHMNSAALRLMERAMAATPSAATPTRQYSLQGAQRCLLFKTCAVTATQCEAWETMQGQACACCHGACACLHAAVWTSRVLLESEAALTANEATGHGAHVMMSSAMASLSITRGARYPGKSVRSRRPRYCRASNDLQQGLPEPALKHACTCLDAPAQQLARVVKAARAQ